MNRFRPNLLPSLLGAALLAGCGTPGAPLPPSLELPKAVTDLRAARKGDKVYLAWTLPTQTTERQTIRHLGPTRICRSLQTAMKDCASVVGQKPPAPLSRSASPTVPKAQAEYTDSLPQDFQQQNPTGQVTYAVLVLNESGRSAGLSNQVQIPAAPTLPAPANFKAQVTAQGVLLTWSCSPAPARSLPYIQYRVRVYRRGENTRADTNVGEADCSNGQLVDQSFEWEQTYSYHATIVTVVSVPEKPEMQVEGDDTPAVKLFAHDVFPPGVPSGLQAVFSGVGQAAFIDLVWAPVTDADLVGYNIYRHEEGGQPVKINSELVKTPAFRDSNVAAGRKYFYSVSAVDLRGNESARSEEATESVP
ncbi:MAG TPA: hypothetical protein VGV15_11275 [Terriglobales bacterium]|nr:hypothetical protein [Terriglobales bacterium]